MTDNFGVAAICGLWYLSEAGCCRRRGALSASRAAAEVVSHFVGAWCETASHGHSQQHIGYQL